MTARLPLWLLTAVALAVMAWSGILMARRIDAFHHANPRHLFLFRDVEEASFKWGGRLVEFTDDRSNADTPVLIIRYGESDPLRLNVTVPGNYDLPWPLPHQDWMRVLRFAEASGMSMQDFARRLEAGELDERLVVVTRIPRPGSDPRTWGSVWKKDWSFDFYEFMADGTVLRHPRLGYPTTRGVRPPKADEIQENTWQFQAALQLMPQAGNIGPTHNFFGNAMRAAGWTLPVAAFSGLMVTLGLAFALAPRRRLAAAVPTSV